MGEMKAKPCWHCSRKLVKGWTVIEDDAGIPHAIHKICAIDIELRKRGYKQRIVSADEDLDKRNGL